MTGKAAAVFFGLIILAAIEDSDVLIAVGCLGLFITVVLWFVERAKKPTER